MLLPKLSSELIMTIVERFVAVECLTGAEHSTRASALYRRYLDWSAGSPNTVPHRHFSRALKLHGFASKRNSQGILYLGIAPQQSELYPSGLHKPKFKRARVRLSSRMYVVPKIKRFIESECMTDGPDGPDGSLKIRSSVAYARYQVWVLANKEPWITAAHAANNPALLASETVSMQTFIGVMRELGFPNQRTRAYSEPGLEKKAHSVLLGLSLRPEPSSETILA